MMIMLSVIGVGSISGNEDWWIQLGEGRLSGLKRPQLIGSIFCSAYCYTLYGSLRVRYQIYLCRVSMDTNSRPTACSLLYTTPAQIVTRCCRFLLCCFFLVTSAKSKPSFSQMRRLKIYMRSTMGEESILGLH